MVENCSSWNARLIRISETFNEAENASLHVWEFIKDCDNTKYFESKWAFLGKKKRFSLYGQATFRRVLMTSQSEEIGHFGTTKFCPI